MADLVKPIKVLLIAIVANFCSYLEQIKVRGFSLSWYQFCQHLRHHFHIAIHHFQLAAQFSNLKKTKHVH